MLLHTTRNGVILHTLTTTRDHTEQIAQATALCLLTQTAHDTFGDGLHDIVVLLVRNSRILHDCLARLLLYQIH